MAVILFNKWLLAYSGFPFPLALTMCVPEQQRRAAGRHDCPLPTRPPRAAAPPGGSQAARAPWSRSLALCLVFVASRELS